MLSSEGFSDHFKSVPSVNMKRRFILMLVFTVVRCADAADFFVASDGKDSNPGTLDQPFATIQCAQDAASPGDTVYIRGGTYRIRPDQIARKQRIWAYVTYLDKSGTAGKPINYFAYKDERPVFDLSQVAPQGLRINAFELMASWIHVKGLEVTGVQVTIKTHTQSCCFENQGSHNILEQLVLHDGQGIGIYCIRGSDNLFLNCDAYRNYDYTSEDGTRRECGRVWVSSAPWRFGECLSRLPGVVQQRRWI